MHRSQPTDRFSKGSTRVVLIVALLAAVTVGAVGYLVLRGSSGAPSKPSVLVITVDTLRPDHMSCYGYPRETTPNLDRLAADGMLFEDVVTPRPKTTPSMVSMLTGLYPFRHGIRTNFTPLPGVQLALSPTEPLRPSADGPRTLAERLRLEGMKTGGFVANFVLTRERSGLQRGFDVFDDELTSSERLRKNIKERKATDNTDRAIRWLEQHRRDPFFLWVHYIDPHGSYSAPPEFADAIKGQDPAPLPEAISPVVPLSAIERPMRDRTGHRIFVARHNLLEDREDPRRPSQNTQDYIDAYDAEILYMDAEVGRLLDAVEDLGLDETTLVIFTSDHGESLGEHSCYFEHGFYIYEASSWIPFIARSPGLDPDQRGRRVPEPVNLLDVYPTVLDWLGLPVPSELPGVSLAPVFRGENPVPDRISFIERAEHSFNMRGVRTEDWKLIYNFQIPPGWPVPAKRELYHLARDPDETRNLYTDDDPETARVREELSRRLLDWARKSGDLRSFAGEDDDAIRNLPASAVEQLKGMGYLEDDKKGETSASGATASTDLEPADAMEEFTGAQPPPDNDPRALLLWALADRPDLRALALEGLARYSDLETATLIESLAATHPLEVRCRAAELLGERDDPTALQPLEQLLDTVGEDQAQLALSCAHSLARLGSADAASRVLSGLQHWNASVRARAAYLIGDLGHADARDELEKLTADPVGEVRVFAWCSLARLGDEKALDALVQEVKRSARGAQPDEVIDPHAVTAGILAVAQTFGKEGLDRLTPAIQDRTNGKLLTALAEANIWADESYALGVLEKVQSTPGVTRRRLLNAIAVRLGERAMPALIQAAKDPDTLLRVIASIHLLRLEAE